MDSGIKCSEGGLDKNQDHCKNSSQTDLNTWNEATLEKTPHPLAEGGDASYYQNNVSTSADDLQMYVEMFDKCQTQDAVHRQQCKTLTEQLTHMEHERNIAIQKVKDLEKSSNLQQESINAIHNNLTSIAQFEEGNRKLKDEVLEKDNKISKLREQLRTEREGSNRLFNESQGKAQVELKQLEGKLRGELESQSEMMVETIQEKDKDLEEFKEQILQLQQEKVAEITRLTMEFESKIGKLQRQKAISAVTQQQSTSNQDIFRRKLQHMKQQFDHEKCQYHSTINSLKEQMAELELKLNGGTINKVSVTSAARKRRL